MYKVVPIAPNCYEVRSPTGGYAGMYADAGIAQTYAEIMSHTPPPRESKDRRSHNRGGRRRGDG